VRVRGSGGINHPLKLARRQRESLFGGVDVTDATDDRATPHHLFAPLESEFAFTLDVAASHDNAKCNRYFTIDDDGAAAADGAPRECGATRRILSSRAGSRGLTQKRARSS
jgi:hypothetical protein